MLRLTIDLRQEGHHCLMFEKERLPGGRLRREPDAQQLPPDILDREIEQIVRLGVELKVGCQVEDLDELLTEVDAVLLSCGRSSAESLQAWGLRASHRGIAIDRDTMLTDRPAVFAAGGVVRQKGLYVRSVADGKLVAQAIHQFLCGEPITPPAKPFSSRISGFGVGEAERLAEMAGHAPRYVTGGVAECPTRTAMAFDNRRDYWACTASAGWR